MAESATDPVNTEELRRKWLDHTLYRHQRILSKLEAPKLPEYPIPIRLKDATLKLRFRAFTHGELMLVAALPFYTKVIGEDKEPMTTTEQETYLALKEKMTDLASLDLNLWRDISQKHPETIPQVYAILLALSNLNEDDYKQLDDFLNSDFGYYYGLVWFQLMHRLPSEVGDVRESDYQMVTRWLAKWIQRNGGNKQ